MDFLEAIGVILIGGLVLLMPGFLLYSLIKWIWETYISSPQITVSLEKGGNLRNVRVEHRYTDIILSSKFSYYQKLPEAEKARFLKRVSRFILEKHFRGIGIDLTEEMVVLIAASAVQLTFGLEEYILDHFEKILIYPREFYNRRNKTYHKGETNMGGAIVLSWKHFTEGYSDPKDRINLGLHEMAHALRFDKFKSDSYDRFFALYIDKWQLISKEEFENIRNHQSDHLRAYAGTNFSEFFSVCVEHFFESPEDFKKVMPEIYQHLCILLNQDPLTGMVGERSVFIKQGPVYFETGTPVMTIAHEAEIPRSVFVHVPVLIGLIMIAAVKRDLLLLKFYLPIFIVGVLFNWKQGKQTLLFYQDGIVMPALLFKRFDLKVAYQDMVTVVFHRSQSRNDNDSVIIYMIENAKLKKMSYSFSFADRQDMQKISDFLKTKKVPAKTDGYDIKLS